MPYEIKCRECGNWTPDDAWDEGEVGCEDCGSHSAMKCPHCGECYDSVMPNWGIGQLEDRWVDDDPTAASTPPAPDKKGA